MWLWRIFPCLTDEKHNDLLIRTEDRNESKTEPSGSYGDFEEV